MIDGGTITATGGYYGAGIGSGYWIATCGDIVIDGGTINATGGQGAPGIGSGYEKSSCGDITITRNVTKVTATSGGSMYIPNMSYGGSIVELFYPNSIGKGIDSNTCGTITIGGKVTGYIKDDTYTYQP